MNTINVLNFADAKLFLDALRRLEKEPGPVYFRGQAKNFPLTPTACRGNSHKWTRTWIEQFVESDKHEYVRFLDCYKWKHETVQAFQVRFELALRDYIEREIVFQFQQFALGKEFVNLSPDERVQASNPEQILDYLKRDEIPLPPLTRYASLLAQHHGVPTRLLDWSSSLNVAIDFAAGGVSSPDTSNGRIVIWVIFAWGRDVPSADPDCDERLLGGSLTQTGPDSLRVMMEKPLKGTCLISFDSLVDSTGVMQITPQLPQSSVAHASYQLHVDEVSEVYINEQRGHGMIDLRHDRHVYENSSCQPMNERIAECPIPPDKVFKFTLPHSRIPWLRPQLKDFSVRRIYDLPMYDQFDDIEPNREVSLEERRRGREHNFLTEVGKRIRTDIDWDAIQI